MSEGIPGNAGIGAVLKGERTRQGLEIAEIEQRTKIRIRYLRALEGEQWDVLPPSAYARGFLRAYATALGIDPEPLLDRYRQAVGGEGDGIP